MTALTRWNLGMAYEPRLGRLRLSVTAPGRTEPCAHFAVPVSTIMRDFGIPPEALRQMAADARKPQGDVGDMEALQRAAVPADCTGLTVLDIGGYDGKMARLALDRGAKSATVLDSGQYVYYGWPDPEPLPGVVYERAGLLDWRKPADVVLFYNVLYHVENPWQALEHLRSITRREMALCTLVTWTDAPVWELYEPREVNPEDDTVYWGPSESGLRRLLKLTGWTEIEEVGKAYERLVLRCK